MESKRISWQEFRKVHGLVGGTLDVRLVGLPNHPMKSLRNDNHFRGTITRILWVKVGVRRNTPACIYVSEVHVYFPGKRAWESAGQSTLRVCPGQLVTGPEQIGKRFKVGLGSRYRGVFTPKGVFVPKRHLLYETKKQHAESQRKIKESVGRMFPGKK